MVDGRRLNSEGKCCPRVDMALASFWRGRKSLALAMRGKLEDRGRDAGDGDFGGGVIAPWRSAITVLCSAISIGKTFALRSLHNRVGGTRIENQLFLALI